MRGVSFAFRAAYDPPSVNIAFARQSGYDSQMKTASISEAKNRLSAYIDLVRKGETVLITDRDRPVARLVPLEPAGTSDEENWLQALERKGLIRRARKRGPSKLLLKSPVRLPAGMSVLRALLDERRGGR